MIGADAEQTSRCGHCDGRVPIGDLVCGTCGKAVPYRLNTGQFFVRLLDRDVLDARNGGSIVGRSDREDDIPIFMFAGDDVFELAGMMHGWEFVVSRAATAANLERLRLINSMKGDHLPDPSMSIGRLSNVLNTNLMRPAGCVWIEKGQFVVNSYAVSLNIAELELLNASGNSRSVHGLGIGDFDGMLPYLQ